MEKIIHHGYTNERVRLLRKRMGLSQSKFAAYFGIPVRTIQKWERDAGSPPEYVVAMMEQLTDKKMMKR